MWKSGWNGSVGLKSVVGSLVSSQLISRFDIVPITAPNQCLMELWCLSTKEPVSKKIGFLKTLAVLQYLPWLFYTIDFHKIMIMHLLLKTIQTWLTGIRYCQWGLIRKNTCSHKPANKYHMSFICVETEKYLYFARLYEIKSIWDGMALTQTSPQTPA